MTYFGEEDFAHCGVCDNCTTPLEGANTHTKERISEQISNATDSTYNPSIVKPANVLDPIQIGIKVSVPKYNEGEVVAIAGEQISVVFPNNETRTFLRSYLTPLNTG
jgi:ATP-dependent DNA helicase RecQ